MSLRFQHHCNVFVFKGNVYVALVKLTKVIKRFLALLPPPLHLSRYPSTASPPLESFQVKLASLLLVTSTMALVAVQVFQALVQTVLEKKEQCEAAHEFSRQASAFKKKLWRKTAINQYITIMIKEIIVMNQTS